MHNSTTRRVRLLSVLAAMALALSACNHTSDSTLSTTSPTATAVTDTFSGSIGQNGTAIHSFVVKSSGYTLLAGYTSISPATVTALGMGIGSWDSTTSTCSLNISQNDAARSGNTALNGTAVAGNFCIRVYDAGNLTDGVTATYTLQVQHY